MKARIVTSILLLAMPVAAAAAVDQTMLNRIADEGFNRGEAVLTAAYLTDHIGPRLTNSPGMRQAERWTQERLRDWGLSNVRSEAFDFGRGWWIEASSVRMVAPRPVMLRSIPIAWTPPTNGTLTAPIVVAPMKRERDFQEWRGKLAGKIVLVSYPSDPEDESESQFKRFAKADIDKLDEYEMPANSPDMLAKRIEGRSFPRKLDAFLKSEGALAWARMSIRENGLVHGEGYTHKVGDRPALPAVELAREDYRRLARLAKTEPVTIEINSLVHFDDSDTNAYNIFADIPGSDPRAGYVMAGAHLDSWAAADGAADNAAGSAVIMEAARILSKLGVRPKRTIRFALWSGEEQGLLGSAAFVSRHLGSRPANPDPETAVIGPRASTVMYPITLQSGYKDLAAYFNIDNGGGKLRGIYAEGNFAAVPMLREWLAPYSSLGASTVVAKPTRATDHELMVQLGLPAFQFIQDPLDYSTRVHHSSVDTFDHLRRDDLRQAAVVLAGVLLSAAESDKPIPKNVVPAQPTPANPFEYKDPAEK